MSRPPKKSIIPQSSSQVMLSLLPKGHHTPASHSVPTTPSWPSTFGLHGGLNATLLPLPPSTQHTTPTRQRNPRRTANLCPLGEWLPWEPLLLIKPSPERNSSSIFVLVRNVQRADHIINIKLPEIRPLSRQTVLIASSLHS